MFLAQAYAAQEEGPEKLKPEAAQEFEKEMGKTRTLKKS